MEIFSRFPALPKKKAEARADSSPDPSSARARQDFRKH